MLPVGLDIGYSSTKAFYGGGRFKLPSIVGTYEDWFSVTSEIGKHKILELNNDKFLVGQSAIDQSQIVERREDRGWIESSMYERLLKYSLFAIADSLEANSLEMYVVSGLPIAYFLKDAKRLKEIIIGEHVGKIDGTSFGVNVVDAKIMPQPFGTLLEYILNDNGGIVSENAYERIGVIDIGGKTTNILSVKNLEEQSKEATSVNVGGWTAVRKLQDYLEEQYPDIDDSASNVEKILVEKDFVYYGRKVDVSEPVEEITKTIAEQIKSEISQRWGSASHFEKILVTGGGAYLVGESIMDSLPHAFVVGDPVYANVKGYYKFAKRSS